MQIEKNDLSELRLSEKDNRSVQEIFSKMIKESPSFQLLELLFFKPGKLRTDLEKELFLSSSSLYRRIVQLNKGLERRGLLVDRNDLCISGTDELQIRLFMTSYFLEVYDSLEWPFHIEKGQLDQAVHYLNTILQLELTPYEQNKLAFLIAVSLIRSEQGYTITLPSQPIHLFKTVTAQQEALKDSTRHLEVYLKESDLNDLFYTLFGNRLPGTRLKKNNRSRCFVIIY